MRDTQEGFLLQSRSHGQLDFAVGLKIYGGNAFVSQFLANEVGLSSRHPKAPDHGVR